MGIHLVSYVVDSWEGNVKMAPSLSSFDTNELPFFWIHFITRSVDLVNDERQLAEQNHQKFVQVMRQFMVTREKEIEAGFYSKSNKPAEYLPRMLKELTDAIKAEVEVPNQIELDSIDLIGMWTLFNADEKATKLGREYNAEVNAYIDGTKF
ncbi:hypothetical protein [Paucilactobacillus nenjiangensis]|uniref:hypothetical protein n=1 Tax=Paucilactobacillus nenjiangensis TaxID=1296540 RepID=UPI0028D858D1|nr:hypothetical protein [Paucilactobacillus nenjiangensis]